MHIEAVSIGANPPDEVNVIVEVPVGGEPIKYEMDKKAGTLVVYPKTAAIPYSRAVITYINVTIKDVTYIVNGICTSTPANCFADGNGVVTFEVTDHHTPAGTNSIEDEVAIHVKDKYNQLFYSSAGYVPTTNKTDLLTIAEDAQ